MLDKIFKQEIRPLALMISLEPVCFKNRSNIPNIFQNLHDNLFLKLVIFYLPGEKVYEVSLSLQPFRTTKAILPPVVLIDSFKNIYNKSVREFIEYPLRLFKPFKRAILAFENRPYSPGEFGSILDEWQKSLPIV